MYSVEFLFNTLYYNTQPVLFKHPSYVTTRSPISLFSFTSLIVLRIWGLLPFSTNPTWWKLTAFVLVCLLLLSLLLFIQAKTQTPSSVSQSTPNTRRFSFRNFIIIILIVTTSQRSLEGRSVNIALWQLRTQRLREVEELSQGHSAKQWESVFQSLANSCGGTTPHLSCFT